SVTVAFSSAGNADGTISLSHDVAPLDDPAFAASAGVVQSFVRPLEDKGAVRIDRLAGDRLRVTKQVVEKDLLGNEKRSSAVAEFNEALPGHLTVAAADSKG